MKTNNEASKGSEPFSMYGFGTLLKKAISKIMFYRDDRHWCLKGSATILLYYSKGSEPFSTLINFILFC